MTISLDDMRAALKQQMEEAYGKAMQLEKAYKALTPDATGNAGKYFGLRMWQAIRKYLRTVGGQASINDIEDELVRANCDMGKYPRRTIKNALCSPYTKDHIFRLTHVGNDEVAVLVEASKGEPRKTSRNTGSPKSKSKG